MKADFLPISAATKRALAESLPLTLAATTVVFLATDSLYESTALFASSRVGERAGSVALAAERLRELAQAHVHDPIPETELNPGRELHVEVLADERLLLRCLGESAAVAEQLCARASTAAAQSGAGLLAQTREPASMQLMHRGLYALAPGILFGLGWFLLRMSWQRRAAVQPTAPIRLVPSAPAIVPTRRHSTPPPLPARHRTREIHDANDNRKSKLIALATRQSALVAESAPRADRSTSLSLVLRPSRPLHVLNEASESEEPSSRPTQRVLHHVRRGRWTADARVLSNAVIAQLINLRDELSGTDETSCTLVRIASGIAGRSLKAHLAAQLAWLLAEDRRRRVLLVEADLDAPSLHEVLEINVPRGFGLSEQLERMQGTKLRDNLSATRIRLGDCLDALLESAWGSPALFQSPHFKRLLERERIDHDFIVVNGPVVGDWPDAQALPLPGSADSVVYVTPQLEAADRDILRGAATSFAGAAKLSIVESEQNHQHPSTPFQA